MLARAVSVLCASSRHRTPGSVASRLRIHSSRYRPSRSIASATGGGTSPSTGSASGDARAHVPRGNRCGRHREERDAVGCGESSARLAQLGFGDARPHRHTEAHELEDALGFLPAREGCELVAADDEDRIVQPELLERVDRSRVRVELDPGVGHAPRTRAARARGGPRPAPTSPCAQDPRRRGREATRARSARAPLARAATWPACGGSNAPPRIPRRCASVTPATRAPRRPLRPRPRAGYRRHGAPPRARPAGGVRPATR